MLLSRIVVYPVKSLDGVSLPEARITAGGILEHDRVYALLDENGKYVNGKRTGRIQLLRCEFDAAFQEIRLWTDDSSCRFQFSLAEPGKLNQWLSDFFGFAVHLGCEAKSGFPDDRDAPGPTICSEPSLHEIMSWYPGQMTIDRVRLRFRTNLELAAEEPFAEDRLFGAPETRRPFDIGDVAFFGHNPCQRCVVPTRDPISTEPIPGFQKIFMEMRQKTLPAWSERSRFNHFYRFAINTSIPETETGKVLRVGDPVRLD